MALTTIADATVRSRIKHSPSLVAQGIIQRFFATWLVTKNGEPNGPAIYRAIRKTY